MDNVWEAVVIDELHVKDVALIHEATLYPSRGLTVISGESGAGKSALLSALSLLIGERGDASLVREGAHEMIVEGRFVCSHANSESAHESCAKDHTSERDTLTDEHESNDTAKACEADESIVQRTISSEGRSRVHIDGSIAGVRQLADDLGSSVDLCGQHEHQRLMRVASHRRMLDAWAADQVLPAYTKYRQAFRAVEDARDQLDAVRAAGSLDKEQLEQARFVVQRIDEVDPQEGEYEQLQADLPKAEHAEALLQATHDAHDALSADEGTLDLLDRAASELEDMASVDPALGESAKSLRDASYVIEDVARDIRSYGDDVDFDVESLGAMQERMSAFQGLLRSWGPNMDDVMAARQESAELLDRATDSDKNLEAAQAALDKAEERLIPAADKLHAARCAAAPDFSQAVTDQMARLELADAALVCSVDSLDRSAWTLHGPDSVEFLFRPGLDMSARPLTKIASGGELSRVMLAIKVVLGAHDDVDTLVFDEVDAGIAGTAARALTDVLVDLSHTHQVIVVTHLPQVAVAGDTHYKVSKTQGEHVQTQVALVEGNDRVSEIARMLSGDTSAATMTHARQLLDERS